VTEPTDPLDAIDADRPFRTKEKPRKATLLELDCTVRFPSVQLLVAEMATALSRADPCLDFQLINDAAAAIVDPDDGSVGAALIELTNGFLMLVVVSLHGMSPFSRRSGITIAR
jgi:hypothetical protein